MTAWLAFLVHAALVALAAPLLDGFLRQAVARRQRRPPPGLLQPWRDLVRQWRKPPLRPEGTSFVVTIGPPVALGTALAAALLVPSFALGPSFTLVTADADLIVIAGLLAGSRLVPALAAADAGAVHPASRIPTARLSADPVLLLVALALTMLTGTTNVAAAPLRDGPMPYVPGLLAGLALLAAVAAEPPAPAIFSGRDLALITAAGQLRRVASLSLVAAVGVPLGLAQPGATSSLVGAWLVGVAFWLLKLGLLGLLASILAPHRVLLPAAALLALIAAVIAGVQGAV